MPRIYQTVTEGSNDAYAQAQLATALTGVTRQAYAIQQIEYELLVPATNFPSTNAAQQELAFGVWRRSKAAMPNISDADVIKKWWFGSSFQTAVGYADIFEKIGTWIPNGEVLIVEDPLYVGIDSTGVGAQCSVLLAIDYEIVEISEVDRLTLLTQSLQ